MTRTALLTLLPALALALLLPLEAQAMYHPRLGRFLQRDPVADVGSPVRTGTDVLPTVEGLLPQGTYADAMTLYQYAGTNPMTHLDPYGLDDTTAEDVRLRVVLDQAHGTTEAMYAATGRYHAVGASWEEGWGTWLVHLAGRAFWDADSSIDVDEETATSSWKATLEIINRLPKEWMSEGWWLRTSVDYWWTVSVENVCCESEKVSLTATGWGCKLSLNEGTFYNVPNSTVHAIPVGESRDVGRAYLGAAIRQKRQLLLLIRGAVEVSAECLP